MTLKQGLVEIPQENDFDPSYLDGQLITRQSIDDLNSCLKKLAVGKVAFLKDRMKKTKGVHSLEWELQRLDMLHNDWLAKTREVQMLRVTKDTMSEKSDDLSEKKEIDLLERTIKVFFS